MLLKPIFDSNIEYAMSQTAFNDVKRELSTSTMKYGTFKSSHEGYGVLKEEVDEMWDAIKNNDLDEAEKEAIQVAAMAMRFIIDVRRQKRGTSI